MTQSPDATKESIVDAIFQSSIYFEGIGVPERAIQLGDRGLKYAERLGDQRIARRAHNALGAIHLRLCHFAEACEHFEVAYRLAIEQEDNLGQIATLANVCALLDSIGLFHLAIRIAKKIAAFPFSDGRVNETHFQSAANAIRWCVDTGDLALATYFFQIASAIDTAGGCLRDISLAYFEANSVSLLLEEDKEEAASFFLSRLGHRKDVSNNVRVKALYELALAKVRLHAEQTALDSLDLSIDSLDKLITELGASSAHYEDVLCTLIQLRIRKGASTTLIESHARTLREYLICKKHKEFYSELGDLALSQRPVSGVPIHSIPRSILSTDEPGTVRGDIESNPRYKRTMCLALSPMSGVEWEKRYADRAYALAEDLAVAAELVSGDDGSHCFKVGRLVREIFIAMGGSESEAKSLEYAARLHDIGKIGLTQVGNEIGRSIRLGSWFMTREHTLLGGKILVSDQHEILTLAAQIARDHHEWWNGAGLPEGKRGEEIVFGARLCAVANTFLNLVDTDEKWSIEEALEQLRAMAGVQLDPSIVDLFTKASELALSDAGLEDSSMRLRECILSPHVNQERG